VAEDFNLRGINLNLLPVLDEIVRQRNLTRAAERLNMTQSAVSNALKQLRDHFADDILVRDGRRMRLTELGLALVAPLDEAMGAMRRALAPEPFDPAQSGQRFRIATADYVMAILAPHLVGIMNAEAPHMSVQMLNARRQSAEDLRVGRIDMIIMPSRMMEAGNAQRPDDIRHVGVDLLLRDRLVCVARHDDPDLAAGLTVERYLARAHAGFFLDYDIHASLEQFHLGETGLRQFDRVLISSFAALPAIAANSDCLALLPETMARVAQRHYPIRYVDPPVAMPPLDLMLVWHRRRDDDPATAWLRAALLRSGECAARG
jgi:LysR family transcriptional regulator, nod-box dependent transcriptional activator